MSSNCECGKSCKAIKINRPVEYHRTILYGQVLNLFLKINHIDKLDTALKDRIVIVFRKEIGYDMGADKTTFFIKRNGGRTVTGTNLENGKGACVFFRKEINQRFSIALALAFRDSGNVLDFQYAVSFVRDNTLAFDTVVIQNINGASFKIPVDHIFLFICQQQQGKMLFFVLFQLKDFHAYFRI